MDTLTYVSLISKPLLPSATVFIQGCLLGTLVMVQFNWRKCLFHLACLVGKKEISADISANMKSVIWSFINSFINSAYLCPLSPSSLEVISTTDGMLRPSLCFLETERVHFVPTLPSTVDKIFNYSYHIDTACPCLYIYKTV